MTRTARASYPRAIAKDRSLSRTGLDRSIHKHGAGQHNWGSILDHTKRYDFDEEENDIPEDSDEFQWTDDTSSSVDTADSTDVSPGGTRNRAASINVTEDDRTRALQFRKGSFSRNDIDLAAIARTSAAVSSSPPNDLSFRRNINRK